MATHGVVSMFDPSTEDWTTYTERMKHYFVANDVTDAKKKHSILLSACGPATYKVIRNLVEEGKPAGYDALRRHCEISKELL